MLGKVFNFVRFPFQLNDGDPVKKAKLAFIIEKVAQKFHLTSEFNEVHFSLVERPQGAEQSWKSEFGEIRENAWRFSVSDRISR